MSDSHSRSRNRDRLAGFFSRKASPFSIKQLATRRHSNSGTGATTAGPSSTDAESLISDTTRPQSSNSQPTILQFPNKQHAEPHFANADASNAIEIQINASSPEGREEFVLQETAQSPIPTITLQPITSPPIILLGSNKDLPLATIAPDNTTQLSASISPATQPTTHSLASQDLWSKAHQKLSKEEKEALQRLQATGPASQSPTSRSVSDFSKAIELIEIVQEKYRENRYKFSFGGKEIIVRDVIGKIVFWLNKVKDVGDIAVNVDPVHAGLPWAGVRFLLQAAISEHEQMESLIMAVEKLSCMTTRGAIYDRLYSRETLSADVLDNLQNILVKMYTAMLRMMALCHRLFCKGTTMRAIHAMFKNDISDFLVKCEELEVRLDREAQICQSARSQEADAEAQRLLLILQEPILRMDERVFKLLEKTDMMECLTILNWVSKVPYGKNHQSVTEKRTQDTCGWLLQQWQYREWHEASASIILWLYGNPGTGKTFLTSKVIDTFQESLKSGPNHEGFAFFYCNRNEAERREPLSALRAFVRQLSTFNNDDQSVRVQKDLKRIYFECQLKASSLSMSDCKILLLQFVNTYPRTTLVLDALDECEVQSQVDLIEVFDHLLAQASNPLKIFISSRPDYNIRRKLKDRASIEIQANDNYDDITKFVNARISQHARWDTMDPVFQNQIVTILQEKSKGMFQWAFLQIEQLLQLDLKKDILRKLGKLPKTLTQAYDEIYQNMSEEDRTIANRAFKWVMCACTPLRTRELLPAVSQDENIDTLEPVNDLTEDIVLKCCHNLLVIDPVRKVWIPSHLSVIEYFEDHLWSQSLANSVVASVCLILLQNTILYDRQYDWCKLSSRSVFSAEPPKYFHSGDHLDEDAVLDEDKGPEDPLSGQGFEHLSLYVRHHWPIHTQKSTSNGNNSNRLAALVEKFLGQPENSSVAYRCWCEMVSDNEDEFRIDDTSVFSDTKPFSVLAPTSIASFSYCAFELSILLPEWHNFNWVKNDNRTETGKTFLELAAEYGSISTCRCLIMHGAETNAPTETDCGSALAAAAYWGEIKVVEFLVKDGGADVNMQLQNGDFGSALAAATYYGEKEVVEFLVKEGGAEVNMQVQHGAHGSALVAAAYGNEKKVVEFLVKEGGAEVNMQVQHGAHGSALVAAAYMGREKVVEFLVEKGGAEVNMQVQYGAYGSALAAAAYMGREKVVEFLVKEGGAEVNMQVQYGAHGSALAAAAYGNEKKVVEFLVKKGGAEVNMQVQHGNCGSALAIAAYMGREEVVEFLVEKGGANVNLELKSGKYSSTLEAARGGGENEIAKRLIEYGAIREQSPGKVVEDKEDEEDERDNESVEEIAK